jgi:hypothetical protein
VQGAASEGDCGAASRMSVPPPGWAYTHNMLHKVCVGVVVGVGVGGWGCVFRTPQRSHTTLLHKHMKPTETH